MGFTSFSHTKLSSFIYDKLYDVDLCVIIISYELYVWYSFKVTSHSLDIFKCESSTCQVDLFICINGSYSVETVAQRKDSPSNAIARTNLSTSVIS